MQDWISNRQNTSYTNPSFVFLKVDKFAVSPTPVETKKSHGGDWQDDNDGWGDDWNQSAADEEKDAKEKRKAELQRKREERKQQRELANKEKRAKSGGAMKLGAVKKT